MSPKTKILTAVAGGIVLLSSVIFFIWYFWDDKSTTITPEEADNTEAEKFLKSSTSETTKLMDLASLVLTQKGKQTKYVRAFFEAVLTNERDDFIPKEYYESAPQPASLETSLSQAFDTLEPTGKFFTKFIMYEGRCV